MKEMSSNGGWWQPPTPPGPPPGGLPPYGPPPGAHWGPNGPTGPGPWGRIPMAPKPGVIPLRPLEIGEIINGVFATIRYNFSAVYGLPFLTGIGCLLLFAVFGAVEWTPLHSFYIDVRANAGNDGWTPSDSELTNLFFAFGGLFLLCLVNYLLTYISATLSSVATLRHAVVGRRVKLRQVASEATPYIWRLLGAVLLMQLLCGAPVLLAIGFTIGLATAAGSSTAPAIALVGFVLIVATSVWGLYAYVRLVPLSATVILEGKGPVESFKRAWRLNEGAWWRSVGVTLLAGIIGSAIQYGVNQVLSIVAFGAFGLTGPSSTVDTTDPTAAKHILVTELVLIAILMPVGMVVSLFTLPLIPLAHGLLYIDRRIRRESLDIQLAEEAGIPFAGSQPQPPFEDTPPPAPAG